MQQQNTELYKWYIIPHSGFEAKVINNIKEEIKKRDYQTILRIFWYLLKKLWR